MPTSRSIALAASAILFALPVRTVRAASVVPPPGDEGTIEASDGAPPSTDPADADPPATADGGDQGEPDDDPPKAAPREPTTPAAVPAQPEPEPEPALEPEPAPPPEPASPLQLRSPPRETLAGGVQVHIDVRDAHDVQLHRLGPGPQGEVAGSLRGVPFHTVCTSPCDRVVEARQHTFFVAAPDIVPSSEFTLDAYERETTIHVRPGRRVVRNAGMGMMIAGALLVPVGILVLATVPSRDGGEIAGGTVTGVGSASLVAGIALLVVGRTRVDVRTSR